MKKINKKKMLIISISAAFIALIIFAIYYFFMPKNYKFYIKENIGELQAVRLDNQDGINGGILVYDMDVVNELYEAMEPVKAWPYYSFYEMDDVNSFAINFLGEDNKQIWISADDYGDYYVADIAAEDNGTFLPEPIWEFIGRFCISKEDGDRLYELVSKRYSENVRNISAKDIEELAQKKDMDWRKFQQFQYTEFTDKDHVRRGEFQSEGLAQFQIEGKKGYVLVWYYSGIVVTKEGSNSYSEVIQAKVYNEKNESIDLYDDGIGKFLEAME